MKYFFYPERRFVTFAPIMSNNPKSPIIDLQQQQLLLRMEYEYEKEEFKRQTETMGVARKVKRGLCWYPVSLGRSYYNSLNQLVIDITRTENKEIEHSFEFGRPVCFFHQSFEGKVKYMNFIATVSFADEERMVVVLPGAGALAELQTDGILGVQLYFDETSYRAMFEALEDTIRAKDNRLAELRDILLGTQKPGFRELYPVRFPWLNSTQETAVNKVLCTRDVSIVHGPPGTGKTTTLVEAIYETLHRCFNLPTIFQFVCIKDILCLMIKRSTLLECLNNERFQFFILFTLKNRTLLFSHTQAPEQHIRMHLQKNSLSGPVHKIHIIIKTRRSTPRRNYHILKLGYFMEHISLQLPESCFASFNK